MSDCDNFHGQKKNIFNASLARNGCPRTSLPKILALMMRLLFWKMSVAIVWRGNLKCGLPSLDLRKAFDRLEYDSLVQALHSRGVPDTYPQELRRLYTDQLEMLAVATLFIFENDTWGETSFCFTPYADQFRVGTCWNQSLRSHGLHIGASNSLTMSHVCLLCNYANEFLSFAKSWKELVEMLEFMGGLDPFSRGVRRATRKTTFVSHRNKNLADLSRNGRTNLLYKFCERDFGRSIRVVDGGSKNS